MGKGFVVVVLVVVNVAVGVVVAIVEEIYYILLLWLAVHVYHCSVACGFSGGCGCGDNDVSGVAGCCTGSLL